jgi:hypothetical protein
MDNVQKLNTCNNIPSSQTFKSHLHIGIFWQFVWVVVYCKHRLTSQLQHWHNSAWLYMQFTGNECLMSNVPVHDQPTANVNVVYHIQWQNYILTLNGKVIGIKDQSSPVQSSKLLLDHMSKAVLSFGSHWDPWPSLRLFQDCLCVQKWGLFDKRKSLSFWAGATFIAL